MVIFGSMAQRDFRTTFYLGIGRNHGPSHKLIDNHWHEFYFWNMKLKGFVQFELKYEKQLLKWKV